MKKLFIIALIAIVAVSSAFAFKFVSIGVETGSGYHISADMEIIDKLDVYARLGYIGAFGLSAGAQYKVAELKVSGTVLDVKPGAQMTFGFADSVFMFSMLATCGFSFETGHFTAFVRPGLGFMTVSTKYYSYYEGRDVKSSNTSFDWVIETGGAYKF